MADRTYDQTVKVPDAFSWSVIESAEAFGREHLDGVEEDWVFIEGIDHDGARVKVNTVAELRDDLEARGAHLQRIRLHFTASRQSPKAGDRILAELWYDADGRAHGGINHVTIQSANETTARGLAATLQQRLARQREKNEKEEKEKRDDLDRAHQAGKKALDYTVVPMPVPAKPEKLPFHKRYLWPNHPIGAVLWGLVVFGIGLVLARIF